MIKKKIMKYVCQNQKLSNEKIKSIQELNENGKKIKIKKDFNKDKNKKYCLRISYKSFKLKSIRKIMTKFKLNINFSLSS